MSVYDVRKKSVPLFVQMSEKLSLSSEPVSQLKAPLLTQSLLHIPAIEPAGPVQLKENNTGLPDQLKAGVEQLSGYSLEDVRVHYNSEKPAQLQAHAFAQGTEIHVAPGQEQHLAHEAWHVVQQKQGRVQPTRQLRGQVGVNDDAGLEREADVMGERADHFKHSNTPQQIREWKARIVQTVQSASIQRMEDPEYNQNDGKDEEQEAINNSRSFNSGDQIISNRRVETDEQMLDISDVDLGQAVEKHSRELKVPALSQLKQIGYLCFSYAVLNAQNRSRIGRYKKDDVTRLIDALVDIVKDKKSNPFMKTGLGQAEYDLKNTTSTDAESLFKKILGGYENGQSFVARYKAKTDPDYVDHAKAVIPIKSTNEYEIIDSNKKTPFKISIDELYKTYLIFSEDGPVASNNSQSAKKDNFFSAEATRQLNLFFSGIKAPMTKSQEGETDIQIKVRIEERRQLLKKSLEENIDIFLSKTQINSKEEYSAINKYMVNAKKKMNRQ